MSAATICATNATIEEVLRPWASASGGDYARYRGHVYRVFNIGRAVLGSSHRDDDLAIASVFHDIGIWSDRTFDYLEPSVTRALDHLSESCDSARAVLVSEMIEQHHRLRRACAANSADVVEALGRSRWCAFDEAARGEGVGALHTRAHSRQLIGA